MKSRYISTERIGVNAIERIVIEELQWIFREQPISDVGIDAMIEIVEDGVPSCKFIATQIKSGKGNFYEKEKSWTYYASDIHYNYWTNSNLPVIIVAYIPEESIAYWTSIIPENFIRTKRQWRIDIPKKQKLNANSQNRLLSLVDIEAPTSIDMNWTFEKIEELTVKTRNISKAASYIHKYTEHLISIRLSQDKANEKFRLLINQGKKLNDPQTQIVIKEIVAVMKYHSPLMEEAIHEFSKLFAIGVEAFKELIIGCKELNLQNVLLNLLPSITTLPETVEATVTQVNDLKITVDKFSKKDKALKDSTVTLSEILSLVTREFTVASDLTKIIIQIIEEES